MSEHPIQGLMKATMENLKEMVDVNTVVGTPVPTEDGGVIIPISRVSFGFAAGGGQYSGAETPHREEAEWPFGGGSGAGVSVQPVGFLVVDKAEVRLLPVDGNALLERMLEAAPRVVEQIRALFDGGESRRITREDPGPS